jgi:hypothetical protein
MPPIKITRNIPGTNLSSPIEQEVTKNSISTYPSSDEFFMIRPGFDVIKEDMPYSLTIKGATVKMIGDKPMLLVSGDFYDEERNSLEESFLVANEYQEGKPLRCLLDAADAMPERNKPIRPDLLIGRELVVTMKNVTGRNGKPYLNLVSAGIQEDEILATIDEETEE